MLKTVLEWFAAIFRRMTKDDRTDSQWADEQW